MEPDDPGIGEGSLFGPYRVVRQLGAGGVGAVYRAVHTGLDKPVVLKVLHPQYARSTPVRARFAREGRAAAAIRHAHVVDVTDVGEHQGTPYLIMELLEGESLGELLDRQGALSPDRAVDLMLPVIAGVEAAHKAGVIHRDLKPDNLFITRTPTGEPHPKVLDFGISRVVSGDGAHHTGTAAILGTPAYMAPEQVESSRDADARSDQYALGVILYECLTGRVAFDADNVYKILKLVGDGSFTPPRTHRPELSPRLEAVVLRAMSKHPVSRFPSLRAFAAALLPFASERVRVAWGTAFQPGVAHGHADTHIETASTPPPSGATPSDTLTEAARAHDSTTIPLARRRSRVAILAVGAVVALAAIVAVVTLQLTPPPSPTTVAAPRAVAAAPRTPPAAAPSTAPVQTPTAAPLAAAAIPAAPVVASPIATTRSRRSRSTGPSSRRLYPAYDTARTARPNVPDIAP